MTSDTFSQPSPDNDLIRQRLRVEAALHYEGVPVRVHTGQLRILLAVGSLPVVLRRAPDGGIRVELRVHLGTCEAPDDDFQQFVADLDAGRETPIVELLEDGTTDLFWVSEFPRTIDVSSVVQAVLEIAKTSAKAGPELRERFFVSPPEADAPMAKEELS